MRAERRLDQLRQAQKETVGLNEGTKNRRGGLLANPPDSRPTLASQGIDKNLAHQGRTLGALSDKQFEQVVANIDKDVAMQAYARQAKNRELEIYAAEIRMRAERRLGELIRAQKATVGLANGKRTDLLPKKQEVEKITLLEAGIDKNLAHQRCHQTL